MQAVTACPRAPNAPVTMKTFPDRFTSVYLVSIFKRRARITLVRRMGGIGHAGANSRHELGCISLASVISPRADWPPSARCRQHRCERIVAPQEVMGKGG